MTASVTIVDKNSSREIILPMSAIYQTEDKAQVWIVNDNKVSLKTVEVKELDGNDVVVSGLHSDEIVVTAGVQKLREGQSVRTE